VSELRNKPDVCQQARPNVLRKTEMRANDPSRTTALDRGAKFQALDSGAVLPGRPIHVSPHVLKVT
jgi:hypothetical protein